MTSGRARSCSQSGAPRPAPIVALRPAEPEDSEFCFQLHKAAMGDVVAAVWGWEDEVQRGLHDQAFAPGIWQIISIDGLDAGLLAVERRPDEIYLGRIEILPSHQGRGLGARIIRELIREAAAADVPLTLDVLAANPRAHALYRRLGLVDVRRHGPGEIKIRMSTPPVRVR